MDAQDFRKIIRHSALAGALDGIDFAVTITNATDEFVYVNPAFTRRYGWLEEEVIGLRPTLLWPKTFPEAKLALLRKEIASAGESWAGSVRNRDKRGALFDVGLATFQVSLADRLPPNLFIGVIAEVDGMAEAINAFVAALARSSFGIKSVSGGSLKRWDRHQQIANLHAHGYSTKEIAGFMRVGPNTPHVIMHRARRKKV
jgi:PAS domain S-box-containing protein